LIYINSKVKKYFKFHSETKKLEMLQLLQIFGLFMVHYNIFAPVKPMLSGGDSFSDAFGKDGIAALLHQPTGGAGGSTDANGLDALQPL